MDLKLRINGYDGYLQFDLLSCYGYLVVWTIALLKEFNIGDVACYMHTLRTQIVGFITL